MVKLENKPMSKTQVLINHLKHHRQKKYFPSIENNDPIEKIEMY